MWKKGRTQKSPLGNFQLNFKWNGIFLLKKTKTFIKYVLWETLKIDYNLQNETDFRSLAHNVNVKMQCNFVANVGYLVEFLSRCWCIYCCCFFTFDKFANGNNSLRISKNGGRRSTNIHKTRHIYINFILFLCVQNNYILFLF